MTQFNIIVFEIISGIVVFIIASIATARIRHWAKEEEVEGRSFAVSCLRFVAARIARPIAVIAIAELIILLARLLFPDAVRTFLDVPVSDDVKPRISHIHAWRMFWGFVLLINSVHAALLLTFHIRKKAFPVPDLLRNIIRGAGVLVVFFAILKFELGLEISALLASTAILSAVIGFALQGVLSNLLAGMSLHIVRSVMPQDVVSISGIDGRIIEANWRETRIRTLTGNIVSIPNSVVASSVVQNISRYEGQRRLTITVHASYADAPGDVIQALVASTADIPDVLPNPAPDAIVTEYKDFGIAYTLRYWIVKLSERWRIEAEILRRIWYEFKRRGIEIPFPASDKVVKDALSSLSRERRAPSDGEEVRRLASDLFESPFVRHLLTDQTGKPLVGPEEIGAIAHLTRRVRYTSGERIFRQGDPGESCYVVLRGRVKGRIDYEGMPEPHEFEHGPGALIGEMSIVTGLPRTATIWADGEAHLLEIPKEAFQRLLVLREEIPRELAHLVAERAAQNTAAYEKLKAVGIKTITETLRRENILQRFLRMIGAA